MEVKLTQYADNTNFLLENEASITPLLKLLKTFSEVHGIKINEKPIKYLGIYVGNDPEECMKINWDDNIKKRKKILVSWQSRDLTIFGKITIIKTLAIRKLTFVAQNLTIPDSIINK